MDKGLLTEIAEMINLIPKDSYNYGQDVAAQILAKIREVVEGARLTGKDNSYIDKPSTRSFEGQAFTRGASAQHQAILRAIDKEDK